MTEKKTTIRDMRLEVEQMLDAGINTKKDLDAALPLLIAFDNAVKNARSNLKACAAALDGLTEQCGAYAFEHPNCQASIESFPNGASALTVEGEDVAFRLSVGRGKLKRTEEGAKLDQAFLNGLPKKWTRSKVELDENAIIRLKVGDEELSEAGLYHPVTYKWTQEAKSDDTSLD